MKYRSLLGGINWAEQQNVNHWETGMVRAILYFEVNWRTSCVWEVWGVHFRKRRKKSLPVRVAPGNPRNSQCERREWSSAFPSASQASTPMCHVRMLPSPSRLLAGGKPINRRLGFEAKNSNFIWKAARSRRWRTRVRVPSYQSLLTTFFYRIERRSRYVS